MPVERAIICPPRCRMGAITDAERKAVLAQSLLGAKYDQEINRESAREKLSARAQEAASSDRSTDKTDKPEKAAKNEPGFLQEILFGNGRRQGVIEQEAKYQARKFMRGILGGLMGKKR